MEEAMATLNIKGFPEDLYRILGDQAKRDHRSLSGEVIYLLEWALETTSNQKQSILQLRGLGKKKWKNMDAAQHIENERQSWE